MVNLLCWVLIVFNANKRFVSERVLSIAVSFGIVAMVLIAPATSKDVNSYALYGRMVSVHHVSPYTHVPRDVPLDPWYPRTSAHWSDSPSVYGPLFTGVSAAITKATGNSVTLTRAAFQAIAAMGLLVAIAVLARARSRAEALALLGLNPLLLTFGVNDAHCDLLVGAAVVAGAVALHKRHDGRAGLWLALAVLVKVSALPAVAGAGLWLLVRERRRAVTFAATAAATMATGVAVAGGLPILRAILDATGRHTRFSLWNPVHGLLSGGGESLDDILRADHFVSTLASALVLTVSLALIWKYRRQPTPALAIAAGLVTYQLFGAYVLSWYAAWSLPVLFWAGNRRLTWAAMAHGSWVALAYLNGYASIAVIVIALLASVLASKQSRFVIPWPKSSESPILARSQMRQQNT